MLSIIFRRKAEEMLLQKKNELIRCIFNGDVEKIKKFFSSEEGSGVRVDDVYSYDRKENASLLHFCVSDMISNPTSSTSTSNPDVPIQKVATNRLKVAKYLCGLVYPGVDITQHDAAGLTVVHEAAKLNDTDLLEYILDDKNDLIDKKSMMEILVNGRCKMGWTPLHYAADQGALKAVQVLINTGANLSLRAFSTNSNNNKNQDVDGESGPTALELVQSHLASRNTGNRESMYRAVELELGEAIQKFERQRQLKENEKLQRQQKVKEEKQKQSVKEQQERELLERKQRQLREKQEKERQREIEEEAKRKALKSNATSTSTSSSTTINANSPSSTVTASEEKSKGNAVTVTTANASANNSKLKKKKGKDKDKKKGKDDEEGGEEESESASGNTQTSSASSLAAAASASTAVSNTSTASHAASTPAPAPAPTVSAIDLDLVSRDQFVDYLLAMGFPESDCLAALSACGTSIDKALSWLCERPNPTENTKTSSASGSTSVSKGKGSSAAADKDKAEAQKQEKILKENLRQINRAWNAKVPQQRAEEEKKKVKFTPYYFLIW